MITRRKGSLVLYACILACVVFVVAMVAQQGRPPVVPPIPIPTPPAPAQPMVLKAVNIPAVSLSACGTGTCQASNGSFQLTASNGAFCIVSLRPVVNLSQVAQQNEVGDVYIYLEYEDALGVSLPWWKLYDGQTTGYSLLDLSLIQSNEIMWHGNPALVSQGGQVCVNQSVQYDLTMWPPSQAGPGGPGLPATVSGHAIVLTNPGNTVTATVN